jgi:hypothetical protein
VTDDELKKYLDGIRQENAAAHAETRRFFEVLTERTRHEIGIVAEKVIDLDEKVTRLDEKLDRRTDDVETRMERGFVETQAMIKFSHAELDRRVRTLEEIVSDLQTRVERLETSTH